MDISHTLRDSRATAAGKLAWWSSLCPGHVNACSHPGNDRTVGNLKNIGKTCVPSWKYLFYLSWGLLYLYIHLICIKVIIIYIYMYYV
jgi:hypothetical protein